MSLLQLTSIAKSFDGAEVLHNLSLDVGAGSVTAIVGDNGAGKSTLLKVMSGIHAPDHGSVMLAGDDVTGLDAMARRAAGIEMVYQDLALSKQQDVVTNLFMGREMCAGSGFLQRKAMHMAAVGHLQRLGIHIADLKQPIGHLSGGQQQAVAIARAAMFEPKVLLLDEPTAALAAREVDRVLGLIRTQKTAGRAVILVSHRLNDVFAVADRIVVMKQGTILSDDPASSVTLPEIVERIVS
ncbi:MAG: ATP-binding cassette domain-containing protein [Bdellovibrionales bacterium]